MRSMYPFLKPYRKQLFVGPFFKFVEAVLELMLPTMMSHMVDQGVLIRDTAYIWRMGVAMLVCICVGLGSALICQYSASIASQGFGTLLRNALFRRINHLPMGATEDLGAASLTNRITNDVNTLQQAVAMLIRLVVRAPFLCIGGLVIALISNARLSLIVLGAMLLFVLVIWLIMKYTVPLYAAVQGHLDKLSRILRENLSGVRVIRALGRSDHERKRYGSENQDYMHAAERVGRIAAVLNPLTLLILNAATVLVLWFGGGFVEAGGMSPGQIIAFINYLGLILQALIVVSTLVSLFTRAAASKGRVEEILNSPEEDGGRAGEENGVDEGAKESQKAAAPAKSGVPLLRFERVSFAYGAAAEPAVSDADFVLKTGETLGILGGTGSGKSTLVQLVPRIFDPTGGHILWDSRPIGDWPLEELRGQVSMVLQRSLLFRGTVAENIRWGKQDATEEEIIEAAKAAQALDFIEAMAQGFGSRVERGGANLSGGQKQRLSIARALVRKPRLLILDDSSSALDYATDARLRAALSEYQKKYGMACIVVSQRVSSLRHAQEIMLLEEGRTIARGSHATLMKGSGEYRELCAMQGIGNGKGGAA